MNIYDMLHFIRTNDRSGVFASLAEFLIGQHATGRIESEDLFYMYQEIMIDIIKNMSYLKE